MSSSYQDVLASSWFILSPKNFEFLAPWCGLFIRANIIEFRPVRMDREAGD